LVSTKIALLTELGAATTDGSEPPYCRLQIGDCASSLKQAAIPTGAWRLLKESLSQPIGGERVTNERTTILKTDEFESLLISSRVGQQALSHSNALLSATVLRLGLRPQSRSVRRRKAGGIVKS